VVACVAAGAIVGALLRYGLTLVLPVEAGEWPWGIFLANVLGSLAMGIFLGRIEVIDRVPPYVTAFVATGFLGGLTTFSTFASEAVTTARTGAPGAAFAYTLVTVVVGWLAVRLGWSLTYRLAR
jgi:fluoride exporter